MSTHPETFVIAHLSDPHLPTPPGSRRRSFANKRLFGYLSWRLRRSIVHRPEILAALVRDLKAAAPDHVVVTGDLVNVSLPSEFRHAAIWLHSLGESEQVTVIPGNHDAYVLVPWAKSWASWAPFMTGDDGCSAPRTGGNFPFLRRRGEVALIGLSTAEPSFPGMAWGRLGAQIEALGSLLASCRKDGLFRVVLLHHPPFGERIAKRKRLLDAPAFFDVIRAHGAELILHGHNHRLEFGLATGPVGDVPVIGAPSASAAPGLGADAAQYHLYRIRREDDGWGLDVRLRVYNRDHARFDERPFKVFSLPHQERRVAKEPETTAWVKRTPAKGLSAADDPRSK